MYFKRFYSILVLVLLVSTPAAFAGDNESIKIMANIMMSLNHFPSDVEKKQLDSIASKTTSENIKILATSMKNLQHAASSEDKKLLLKVINDKNASENVRQLASIVFNLHHQVSNEDRDQLSTMINLASDS